MMLVKKYFSMAEVTHMSGLPAHKLRYIEKADPNIEIIQIRGRRYYTKNNIDYIKATYSIEKVNGSPKLTKESNLQIISKIDRCLQNFQNLLKDLQQISTKSSNQ